MLLLILVLFATLGTSKIHHLFVGNFYPPASLHALEFNDKTLTLTKTATFLAYAPHAWIAFSENRKNIYATSLQTPHIASYSILNSSNIRPDTSLLLCRNKTSAYVLSTPGSVYTASWPGPNACGTQLSAFRNGTLRSVEGEWGYGNSSGVHGLAVSNDGWLVYSADLSGDKIWTHSPSQQNAMQEMGSLDMPVKGMHPRHLVAHPGGGYLHVVMEAGNEVVEYSLDDTSIPTVVSGAWGLIPEGANNASYWSAEIAYSPTTHYLWATSRAQQNTSLYGYISCFSLDGDGRVERRLFMVPTSTRSGIANAVAPAPWSDEWVAMADFGTGYVQIWRLGMDTGIVNATPVARVDIPDGGCCANAIWYD